tara:strand:- start:48 stop:389 length:342 start_codon:yes stop_codon:yes gene_type:complete
MGPKKKMAKGGAVKKRGGIARTMKTALERAKARKPGGRLNVDDIKRALAAPKGRSAAAKKAAMKGVKTKGSRMLAKLTQGKGNPAGKDLSMRGAMRRRGASLLAKLRKARAKK